MAGRERLAGRELRRPRSPRVPGEPCWCGPRVWRHRKRNEGWCGPRVWRRAERALLLWLSQLLEGPLRHRGVQCVLVADCRAGRNRRVLRRHGLRHVLRRHGLRRHALRRGPRGRVRQDVSRIVRPAARGSGVRACVHRLEGWRELRCRVLCPALPVERPAPGLRVQRPAPHGRAVHRHGGRPSISRETRHAGRWLSRGHRDGRRRHRGRDSACVRCVVSRNLEPDRARRREGPAAGGGRA